MSNNKYYLLIYEYYTAENFKKWLAVPDPSINHNNARKKWHKNTGQWLLKDDRYVAWKKYANSFMWINGICE